MGVSELTGLPRSEVLYLGCPIFGLQTLEPRKGLVSSVESRIRLRFRDVDF